MAITERGWATATRPRSMIEHLETVPIASERQARLFGVACCRSVYGAVFDPRALLAVDVAERFADGLATSDELAASHAAAQGAGYWDRGAEYRLTAPPPAAKLIIGSCAYLGRFRDERTTICNLVRDIFGNPFRPVAFDPAWRTDTAVALARTMYDSREFGAMPILADALQDAGCEDEQVLSHCRDANHVHVRGCWVCDAVLSLG